MVSRRETIALRPAVETVDDTTAAHAAALFGGAALLSDGGAHVQRVVLAAFARRRRGARRPRLRCLAWPAAALLAACLALTAHADTPTAKVHKSTLTPARASGLSSTTPTALVVRLPSVERESGPASSLVVREAGARQATPETAARASVQVVTGDQGGADPRVAQAAAARLSQTLADLLPSEPTPSNAALSELAPSEPAPSPAPLAVFHTPTAAQAVSPVAQGAATLQIIDRSGARSSTNPVRPELPLRIFAERKARTAKVHNTTGVTPVAHLEPRLTAPSVDAAAADALRPTSVSAAWRSADGARPAAPSNAAQPTPRQPRLAPLARQALAQAAPLSARELLAPVEEPDAALEQPEAALEESAAPAPSAPLVRELRPSDMPHGVAPGATSPHSSEGLARGDALAPSDGMFEVIDQSAELQVLLRRSKLLRTKVDIYRTAVVDPRICDVVQFTPREVSIIGRAQGATHVTFWFDDGQHQPLTYLVRVTPDPEVQQRREQQYEIFEDLLAELFPDSKVRLVPVADKLIVKGEARDVEEAAQILAVIRGQAVQGGRQGSFGYGGLVSGRAAEPLVGQDGAGGLGLPASQVINMLRVPGVQQVALRVKIAELDRSAARRFGVDLDMSFEDGNVLLQSLLNAASGSAATVLGNFDGDQINFGMHFLHERGVVRLLSEPTLVTMSGRPASFVAGGEFAVPTTVGVGGAAAVTTDFRAFGAIISFVPTVVDKDRIRLQVSPEFSQVNQDLSVNNTPGLDTRAVTTTVEMREGQTLAIAGLLDDSMEANLRTNLPLVGQWLGARNVNRNETELIILVTPELVHPLEPEETPPLPGFDVSEPTNTEFYLGGHLEGRPTLEYRSTVWPSLRRRYQSGGPAMISGPFGHGQ